MRARKKRERPDRGSHHLDRRAHHIVAASKDQDGDQLLDTKAVADLLCVSIQFLEIGRHRGYGPAFKRLSPRMIRYRRSDVVRWLDTRASHRSTREYA